MKFKKVVIIGMGLIGGSIGKVLLKKKIADEVVGVCRRQSSLDRAIQENSLTVGYVDDYATALKDVDIVVIATPVHTIKNVLTDIAEMLDDVKVIVTDVGSTKKEIVEYAASYKDKYSFVGAHPLAGSEKAGVEYSSADLFQEALCLLTRDEFTRENDLETIRELWGLLGANVEILTTEKHDELLSFTSHLPHLIAYSLVGIQEKDHKKYISTGFRDTTRVAASDPVLWSDIFTSNRDHLLDAIGKFKELLNSMEDDIRMNNKKKLEERLEKCRKVRDEII